MAPIRFGFLLYPYQLLDVAGPMDVLSSASRFGLQFSPKEVQDQGLDIELYHVGANEDPVHLSGGFVAKPTATFGNCPKLDYLLIGGSHPNYAATMPTEIADFIRQQSEHVKTVFTTCTGAMTLAATGLLDGIEATVNHEFISQSQELAPKVKWRGDANWVTSGKYWTSSGAIAGMDMVAEWVKQTCGADVMREVQALLAYQRRDVNGKFIE